MLQLFTSPHVSSAALPQRQQRIFNFLSEHPIATLSSVTPDGNPHGVIVYFAIERDFTLHLLTKTGTRKYDNLLHNDHVMLTVCDPETQTVAQVTGIAKERGGSTNIKNVADKVFGAAYKTSTNGLPPIVKLQAGAFTTFQINPVQIRMAIYARPESGTANDLFESIESFDFKRS